MSNQLTVIDLFSGVGGFSLGAARAGFDVVAAVEIDPIAIASHKKNFPNTKHLQRNIRTLSGLDLLEQAGLKPGELCGLIGGPAPTFHLSCDFCCFPVRLVLQHLLKFSFTLSVAN